MAAGEAELMEFVAGEVLGMADLDAIERKVARRHNRNTSGSKVNMELLSNCLIRI
jgi:hypothetical protein